VVPSQGCLYVSIAVSFDSFISHAVSCIVFRRRSFSPARLSTSHDQEAFAKRRTESVTPFLELRPALRRRRPFPPTVVRSLEINHEQNGFSKGLTRQRGVSIDIVIHNERSSLMIKLLTAAVRISRTTAELELTCVSTWFEKCLVTPYKNHVLLGLTVYVL
jgi:hypothetical protein